MRYTAIDVTPGLIESTATDIIAAIREHGPTRDVIIPRLEKLIAKVTGREERK